MGSKRRGTERKVDFIPLLADNFVELGYHHTTTAQLARRCEVRENELYRIWPSKKSMFLEAIRYVFACTLSDWTNVGYQDADDDKTLAERLISHQARNHGHRRFYRPVFSGLTEVNDADVRRELRKLYRRFHETVTEYVTSDRVNRSGERALDACMLLWGQSQWGGASLPWLVSPRRTCPNH
jgi:AcrR family transcriptional regulator